MHCLTLVTILPKLWRISLDIYTSLSKDSSYLRDPLSTQSGNFQRIFILWLLKSYPTSIIVGVLKRHFIGVMTKIDKRYSYSLFCQFQNFPWNCTRTTSSKIVYNSKILLQTSRKNSVKFSILMKIDFIEFLSNRGKCTMSFHESRCHSVEKYYKTRSL